MLKARAVLLQMEGEVEAPINQAYDKSVARLLALLQVCDKILFSTSGRKP